MTRILVVEDEVSMQKGLRDNLELEGFEVDVAGDGQAGLSAMTDRSYDLVILDVMLPRLSGFDVLRQARSRGLRMPVIMLTARGEEIDRVLGLELGADDYVTKPFSLRELLARVKAVLRRAEGGAGEASARMLLGELEIDFETYNASRQGEPLEMTPKEFEILKCLWHHRNKTVTRDQLLTEVWGYDEPVTTRTIDNFIAKLRQKIEDDPSHPRRILTVHGTGYRLIV